MEKKVKSFAKALWCIAGAVVAVSLLSCGPGNSSVVSGVPDGAKVAGRITGMNGDPVQDARVYIRPYNYLPHPDLPVKRMNSTVRNVLSTTTDNHGWFAFDSTEISNLFSETAGENGSGIDQFVIEAVSKDSSAFLLTGNIIIDRGFIESNTWMNINSLDVGTVLKPASKVKGTVPKSGDTIEGFVLVYGLDTYASIEPDGSFALDNMPEGPLRLLFLYMHPDTGYAEVTTISGTTSIIDTGTIIDLNPKQVRAKGMGTVSAPDEIISGEPAAISAVPDKGYEFRYWKVTGGSATFADSTEASTSVTFTSTDAAVEAVFGTVTFEKTFLGADILMDIATTVKYHTATVLQTDDGGYALTGVTSTEVCLIKTDAEGDSLWIKAYTLYGDPLVQNAHLVQQTSDGGFVIAGYTTIGEGDVKTFLIKTDENGDVY